MKVFFTRYRIFIFFLLFFPYFLPAQGFHDYSILLKSGKYIPEENISRMKKDDEVLQKSLFGNKYYVTIQFYSLPNQELKNSLSAAGIELIDYIPNNAYTASINSDFKLSEFKSFPIRSLFQLSSNQKTIPEILNGNIPDYAVKKSGFADVDILLYEKLPSDKILLSLTNLNAIIIDYQPLFRMYTIRVPQNNLSKLVALPYLQWAEYIAPPNVPENLPGRSQHRVNVLNDGVRNLKGDGMNVGVWDQIASQHLDFSPAGRLINVSAGAAGSHGTHVSGTIGSRGLINPVARGMAPNATVYSYVSSGDVQATMATAIPNNTLIASNHSYHDGLGVQCGVNGASASYSLRARNTDINLNNNLYHLHCHSAGNAQSSCTSGWGTITGTGKSAKNNVVVAAITSLESMTSYSSFGPVHDGRVKPEISAMGDNVFSTYTPLNSYATISGTSMSTPGITGTLTLLAQRYKQLNSNVLPPSTLIKNIACNTARDLGNPGPDYRFGFGRINALSAVRILEQNRYVIDDITTGATKNINITIPAGAARLRVMLTWNDPAAAANSSFALVNNLDLIVAEGANTYLPWILNPLSPSSNAIQADDNISNIEQVTVNNPAPGNYTLSVTGEAVAMGPEQVYSLTWDVELPYIEVIYPNGGESFSPNGSQVITWDNAGVTGAQTVEYSLNNGANWTVISSTVAAATTRLTWSIPSTANTSTALIRITSGTITDISDDTFKILGTPTGFSGIGSGCSAGEITFNWAATANATHYDISMLNAVTGYFIPLASNLTGTTYTASGLTPSAGFWFHLTAKNNTIGAISERSLAINVTASGGGGSLGAIGSISGNDNICGPTNGVTYSIAPVTGASNYTWGIPPGAVIANGQGTTTISVDYGVGSSNGNISVFGSSGSCQTSPASIAITINAAVASATSGGDQTQTACPPNPLPTLTATATVASGLTLVWYDAPTGGNVVSNPTWNTVGTKIYYAAGRNNSTNCESATRTPVTLTINQAPPAVISASGPTIFCQGGSVILTANPGNAYTWSNGASTQSITVNASEILTVNVTQSGGCVTTSAPTTVTVNAIPPTSITAGGPATFCDGSNVVLTATSGNSYSWSNGATTPSITVANSGSFTVTVTHANGCTSSSTPAVVTVNPKPVVALSALPFTRLYPGLNTTLTAAATPAANATYSWTKNGTLITGAMSATLLVTLTELGNYAVTVTNSFGCSSTSNLMSVADSATARLFIFPNPSSGQFQVSYYNSSGTTSYSMIIYDSKGALVQRTNHNINGPYDLLNVDIRRFGRGVYNVAILDRNGKRLASGGVVIQ